MSARSNTRARAHTRAGEGVQALDRRNASDGRAEALTTPGRSSSQLTAARLLTAEQLAARWQVSKQHVWRLTRSGQLPTVRLGKYCRYRVEDVEAWEREGGTANA